MISPSSMQVFFCVLVGAFSLGQASPNLESMANARGAAYEIYAIINKVFIFQAGFVVMGFQHFTEVRSVQRGGQSLKQQRWPGEPEACFRIYKQLHLFFETITLYGSDTCYLPD